MANREKLLRLKWGNTSCQTGTDRARTYFQGHKFRTEFVSKIFLSNSSHVLQATTLRNQETSSKTVAVKSFHLFSVRWQTSQIITACHDEERCWVYCAGWTTWTPGTREPAFGQGGTEINLKPQIHIPRQPYGRQKTRNLCANIPLGMLTVTVYESGNSVQTFHVIRRDKIPSQQCQDWADDTTRLLHYTPIPRLRRFQDEQTILQPKMIQTSYWGMMLWDGWAAMSPCSQLSATQAQEQRY